MKIKPILFSTPMVQAILEDRKTQTRRIIKSKHESGLFAVRRKLDGTLTNVQSLDWDESDVDGGSILPKAQVGDILWVRETFALLKYGEIQPFYGYKADGGHYEKRKWKPSIFMPKAACRIFLEVTSVRVERLHDISEEDAIAEGIRGVYNSTPKNHNDCWLDYMHGNRGFSSPNHSFKSLWQSINGNESWEANPWVWVYDFKRVEKPKNFLK